MSSATPGVAGPHQLPDLSAADLHHSISDPVMGSMNLLNEVADRYPDAISFAAGRPYEGFFDVESIHEDLRRYADHLRDRGFDEAMVRNALFQYGPTKGVINHLVAGNLLADEGVSVDERAIMVTVGCQEGLFLALRALRRDERDVVLAVSPMYVGLSGAARLADLPVLAVRDGGQGVDLEHLVAQVRAARADGRRPTALYMVPSFANPSGQTLSLETRRRVLAVAAAEDLLVLEDNAYGLFGESDDHIPTLKSLDTDRRVVYLGSFAKTVMPGARVGYVVADQRVAHPDGTVTLLADELAKLKSMVTVNTPSIAQAVIGGRLLGCDLRLSEANRPLTELYRGRRRTMLAKLDQLFGTDDRVRWTAPSGGFFVVLQVPFAVTDALLAHSARRHGVLWTPMNHFYAAATPMPLLRLSCSAVTDDEIEQGLDRLERFVAEQATVAARGPTAQRAAMAASLPERRMPGEGAVGE